VVKRVFLLGTEPDAVASNQIKHRFIEYKRREGLIRKDKNKIGKGRLVAN
jgi:hypothetical protein